MIYLDNSATTIPDERVIETFNKVCKDYPGNANSIHSLGFKSKSLEEHITSEIKRILKLNNFDIIYTSGASESNNTVLKGVASRYKNRGNHIIISPLEHSSITETCKYLETKGFTIDTLKVNKDGLIDIDYLKEIISDNTILISVSLVDSELGIKQNISKIKEVIKSYPKCYFHVDITQGVGKIDIPFSDIDFASMSAHKIFGLKGIGLLIKKNNISIDPLINGGKSTTIYRSGTPALPLMASLMKALKLIIPSINSNYQYVSSLNELIINNLKKYPEIHINSTKNSIPYIINISIRNIKSETFIHAMEEYDIYISTRSACSKDDYSSSIYSLYHDKEIASHSIRISLSYKNTKEEIEKFNEIFDIVYKKLNFK